MTATKPCVYYLQGKCLNTSCRFSHTKPTPTVCSFYLKGTCTRDNCPYEHPISTTTPTRCVYFDRGNCSRGNQCKFLHSFKIVPATPESQLEPHLTPQPVPKASPKVCEFFLRGCCIKTDCRFLHPTTSITSSITSSITTASPTPSPQKQSCYFYDNGGCEKENCPYMHIMSISHTQGDEGGERVYVGGEVVRQFTEEDRITLEGVGNLRVFIDKKNCLITLKGSSVDEGRVKLMEMIKVYEDIIITNENVDLSFNNNKNRILLGPGAVGKLLMDPEYLCTIKFENLSENGEESFRKLVINSAVFEQHPPKIEFNNKTSGYVHYSKIADANKAIRRLNDMELCSCHGSVICKAPRTTYKKLTVYHANPILIRQYCQLKSAVPSGSDENFVRNYLEINKIPLPDSITMKNNNCSLFYDDPNVANNAVLACNSTLKSSYAIKFDTISIVHIAEQSYKTLKREIDSKVLNYDVRIKYFEKTGTLRITGDQAKKFKKEINKLVTPDSYYIGELIYGLRKSNMVQYWISKSKADIVINMGTKSIDVTGSEKKKNLGEGSH
eukprot:TRINITY_DN4092_c0_g1_i1.p1 TRINITY_DN4092_c0_g1~~TRINITY_DN4092_c0_g1_i1.p1  ORF type:complete len:555 (-),score=92.80 TRINITY_DN4092_c0_g1_i1:1106-2770(-)